MHARLARCYSHGPIIQRSWVRTPPQSLFLKSFVMLKHPQKQFFQHLRQFLLEAKAAVASRLKRYGGKLTFALFNSCSPDMLLACSSQKKKTKALIQIKQKSVFLRLSIRVVGPSCPLSVIYVPITSPFRQFYF